MIDSRRWPSWTGADGSRSSNPSASGPRWAMRSVMVRTRSAPSRWAKAPAMPHTSGHRDLLGGVAGDEGVHDPDVRLALEGPAEAVLDPEPARAAHPGAPVRVVEQVHDRVRVGGDVAVADVDGALARGDAGLLEVERDDRQAERHVLERLVHG